MTLLALNQKRSQKHIQVSVKAIDGDETQGLLPFTVQSAAMPTGKEDDDEMQQK